MTFAVPRSIAVAILATALAATTVTANAADTPAPAAPAAAAAASAPTTTLPASTRDFPPGLAIPDGARVDANFDAERATAAWLAKLSPEQRAQSDAYFEGGYWLQVWSLLWSLGILALLLLTPLSRWMRDRAERITQRPWRVMALYAAMYFAVTFVLSLPLTIYTEFVREHAYGLSNLSFGAWVGEALTAFAVNLVMITLMLSLIYVGVRGMGRRWWVAAPIVTFVLFLLLNLAYPLVIAPLFNRFQALPEGPARDAIVAMARANRIPTDHIEWFDASKQTTRVSANVSGALGVTRINLNDNLLERTSLPEIKAILGHEMGHYVLDHIYLLTVYFTLVLGILFWLLAGLFERALARYGPRLGLRDRADPAALPLAAAIFTVLLFLATPVFNTITRTVEAQADAFGLNAAREPEGFAMSAMRLSTYRKLHPGPVEEFVFYDHPSGYTRVHNAMLWRAENR